MALLPRAAQAVDPTTADCLAANERALAMGNEHKLRTARAQLLVCAAASCPSDVRAECVRRVGEVNGAIPTIVFEARDAQGRDLSAVRVTMDGELLAERLEGIALSVDPGFHTFGLETVDLPRVEKRLLIREGEKDRRERVTFGAAAPAGADGPVTTLRGTALGSEPRATDGNQTQLGPRRVGAIVAAGVGVIGLGLGIGYGLDAMSTRDTAQATCPTQCADQHGVDLWHQAHTAGTVSTIAFIVGGVGLATGAVLWFTGGSSADAGPTTQVGLGPGTMELRRTW
jgi:hypothetical protein